MKHKVLATALFVLSTFTVAAQDAAHMEAMMKAGTPGDAQKKLDVFAGTFNVKMTMWMAPGAPPASGEGTSESKWVMGGRYLEQRFKGNVMGMPFEGVGYTGFDNVKKQYWGSWMDSMSTAMMVSSGWMPDGKTWLFSGSMADPMTGKDTRVEERITVQSADQHTMEMYGPAPDGTMFRMMELVSTRKK
jgi:Protein of unknown function (DUF1579)